MPRGVRPATMTSLSASSSEDRDRACYEIVDALWDTGKALGDDVLDLSLEPLDRGPFTCGKLDLHKGWTGHRLADTAQHQTMHGNDLGHCCNQRFGDVSRGDIINLAYMGHRILSGGRLQAHRPARRNQAVDPVSASNLTVIARLTRCPCHGKIDIPRRQVVGGVDAHSTA